MYNMMHHVRSLQEYDEETGAECTVDDLLYTELLMPVSGRGQSTVLRQRCS